MKSKNMKVFYPYYYQNFRCIAEKCTHSCCVGWEISVDDETLENYTRHNPEYCDYIDMESRVISLCDDSRCPFLTGEGLCKIISEFGDGYVSRICREHPRFYHKVCGRVEGGIGMVCEEAARIILTHDDYTDFLVVEKNDTEWADESEFDGIGHREDIYKILGKKDLSFHSQLDEIRGKYSLPKNIHTSEEWNEIFSTLEYLDEDHFSLFKVGNEDSRPDISEYLRRFFAYLIFRHLSVAKDMDNLRARLGFCLLLVSVLENYTAEREIDAFMVADFARIISEEIEYSNDNTDALIFEFESELI